MVAFIFSEIENLTNNYHSGGGLVVIAGDISEAIALAQEKGVAFAEAEIADVKCYALAEQVQAEVFIFPDAGCC